MEDMDDDQRQGEELNEEEQVPGGEVIEGLFAVPFDQLDDQALRDLPPLTAVPASSRTPGPLVPVQEFFIPIHAFVRLTKREVEVVDHPAFQRLGEVLQLGQTHLVYRGATHRRLEHALGTLHVAHLIMEALHRNADAQLEGEADGNWAIDRKLSVAEIEFVRLGALLHDIGHLPAGHTFEDELGLFAKHDSLERLDLVFERDTWDGVTTEPLGELLNHLYGSVLKASEIDVTSAELVRALVASDYADVQGENAFSGGKDFRLQVCRDLIGNTICADLLDYLHRDLHHLGKHKQFDTRLIDYMEIRRSNTTSDSKLVVNLREGDKLRHDAVSGVLDLLESRYQLFEAALYHRTKLAAAAMLERAVGEIADASRKGWLSTLPEKLLDASDSEMLAHLRHDAQAAAKRAKGEKKKRLTAADALFAGMRQRQLHAKLYQRFQDRFTPLEAERVRNRYGHTRDLDASPRGTPARNRLVALRTLEQDFDLPPLSLGMYCPPADMSTKVAEVKVLRGGRVDSLATLEKEEDSPLTGGHLAAQRRRFESLWHVYFSCDRGVLADLRGRQLYPLLIQAIDCFVLELSSDPVMPEEWALTIAQALATAPGSPWHQREVIDEIPAAMRGRGQDLYPSGLPALHHLYKK